VTYMRIALATVYVSNEANLRAAWRLHGGPESLVGQFVCEAALTDSQLRKLPKGLRERLVQCPPKR
jgi:hypothetical protein